MTFSIFGFVVLVALDLLWPRSSYWRGIKGWYAMRSFNHPFEVLIYGLVLWAAPPVFACFLWTRLIA